MAEYYAKSKGMAWGTIDTIPEIVGLAVTTAGHVGYYIGGGYVIEFKGFAYGSVKTELKKGKWTHWYVLPFLDYGTADVTPGEQPDGVLELRHHRHAVVVAQLAHRRGGQRTEPVEDAALGDRRDGPGQDRPDLVLDGSHDCRSSSFSRASPTSCRPRS